MPSSVGHRSAATPRRTRRTGRVTIAEALKLTALVARKQPERFGRFAALWLCLWLEEHERAMLEDVELLGDRGPIWSAPSSPLASPWWWARAMPPLWQYLFSP